MRSLRALGPGHAPLVIDDVRFDTREELTIRAPIGALLRGRVMPQLLVEQLRKEGVGYGPGLSLEPAFDSKATHFPAGQFARFELEADGSFEIAGIPPGTWRLNLCWATPNGPGFSPQRTPLELLTLGDGERRALDLALGHLARGTLRARVRYAEKPFANGQVRLESGPFQRMATTDADGRLETLLPAGLYRAFVYVDDPLTRQCGGHACEGTASIVREQILEVTFDAPACR
jgi:hypothetical protein